MNRRLIVLMIGMQGLILLLSIAQLAVSVHRGPQSNRASSLSVPAVPIGLVTEYPECADHLLRTMNITTVHVERFNGTLPGAGAMNDPAFVAWQAAQGRSRRNQS
jgi:hypothetical protein